ncbi:citrate lyase holo-[acyl-carrier protein] synthase [Orientia tsutsugamushi]|uniref:citrate lyase holo-[acyl-carrier protein] synthase n=1 Tax=Orientia tsutsugamushi TaxID=784 RepID=UPI00315D4DC5
MINELQRKILNALDQVYLFKNSLIIDYRTYCLVSISLNVPGWPKTNKTIQRLFKQCLNDILSKIRLEYLGMITNDAGEYCYFQSMNDPYLLKSLFCVMENNQPYYRVIDIDVYSSNNKVISRNEIGYSSRACFLCNKSCEVCIATQSHSKYELRKAFYQKMQSFYNLITVETP